MNIHQSMNLTFHMLNFLFRLLYYNREPSPKLIQEITLHDVEKVLRLVGDRDLQLSQPDTEITEQLKKWIALARACITQYGIEEPNINSGKTAPQTDGEDIDKHLEAIIIWYDHVIHVFRILA